MEFSDYTGQVWRVDIEQDGFTGSSQEVFNLSDDPVRLKWEAVNPFETIFPSEMQVDLKTEVGNDLQFDEFFTANTGKYRATLKLIELSNGSSVNVIYWKGINVADNYSEPFVVTPYPSTVSFFDGLSYLEELRFEDSNGDKITNVQTLREVLFTCLDKIGLDIDIADATNVFHSSISDTDSPLNNTKVNPSVYQEEEDQGDKKEAKSYSCRKVVMEICRALGAYITLWDGKWWIIRWGTNLNDTIDYFVLQSDGTESSNSVDHKKEPSQVRWLRQDQELTIRENVDRLKINYTSETETFPHGSIFQNSYFVHWSEGTSDTNSNYPLEWTTNNLDSFIIRRDIQYQGAPTTPETETVVKQFEGNRYLTEYNPLTMRFEKVPAGTETESFEQLKNARHSTLSFFHSDEGKNYGSSGVETYQQQSDITDKYIEQTQEINLDKADNLILHVTPIGHIKQQSTNDNVANIGHNHEVDRWLKQNCKVTQLMEVKLTDTSANQDYYLTGTYVPGESSGAFSGDYVLPTWETSQGYLTIPIDWLKYSFFWFHPKDEVRWDDSQGRKNIEITTDTFPFTGNAKIRLRWFAPYSNIKEYNDNAEGNVPTTVDASGTINLQSYYGKEPIYFEHWGVRRIRAQYISNNDSNAVTRSYIQSYQDQINRKKVEVIHGDGPSHFARGSFRDNNEDQTSGWERRRKTESTEILNILSKEMGDMLSERQFMIRGTFMPESGEPDIRPIDKIEFSVDKKNSTQKLEGQVVGMEWRINSDERSIDLWEIRNENIVSDATINGSAPSKQSTLDDGEIPTNNGFPTDISGSGTQSATIGGSNQSNGPSDSPDVQFNIPL